MNIERSIQPKFKPKKKLESNPEDNGEAYFQKYLDDLRLSREDLKGKILDVGSGNSALALFAKKKNVSSEIYSIDPWSIPKEKTKFVIGAAEALPFKDNSFDLIISNCAIPNIFFAEKDGLKRMHDSLMDMMYALKPGGEIRLGNVLRGRLYPHQREFTAFFDQMLQQLKDIFHAEIEEEHISSCDHYESKKSKFAGQLLSENYFIKIKKPLPNLENGRI